MRTEIDRRFSWGFVLSEQDLRRIAQTGNDHAAKLNPVGVRQLLSAKLRDGAVVESPDLDDILSLENFGTKAVERLSIAIREDSQEPAWSTMLSSKMA